LRIYEQVFGELTARVDKAYTDILEKIIEVNANSSPTHAHVETRMESVNYLRFDLFESTAYKTTILDNAASMATFAQYQNVVKTNLMNDLATEFAAAGNGTDKVAAYDKWARKVDESYIACRILGDIGNISGAFTHAVTHYGTWPLSSNETNGKSYARWFYQWTYIDLEDTTGGSRINNVSGSFVSADLRTCLDKAMEGLRTYTMTSTQKDALHEGLRKCMYFWLDRKIKTE
jgi:hypothetical protein